MEVGGKHCGARMLKPHSDIGFGTRLMTAMATSSIRKEWRLTAEHVVLRAGERLALTVREFDLLRFLVANAGTAWSREDLLRDVWGWTFGDASTVTVHVRRLREKVEEDPTHPMRLATVWGVGYRWEAS